MFKSFATRSLIALGCMGVLFLSGSTVNAAQKIRVYDIPKEQPRGESTTNPHGAANPHGGMQTAMPRLKWAKLPDGWKENAEPGQMRAASFTISQGDNEAELGVYPIGEVPNVELEIISIWRSQLKLERVSETELAGMSRPTPVGAESGKIYDMVSTEPVLGDKYKARMLVVALKRAEANWFFKLSGEDEFVTKQRAALLEFLKGVSFETAQMPPSRPPMAGGGMGGGMQGGDTVKAGTGEHPDWKVPAGWTELDHSSFIVAKFRATGEGSAQADINISQSGGAAGGLLMNVNRWRGQLSLGPLDQAGVDKLATAIDLPTGKGTLVDMSGAESENGGKARCIGVVVPLANETWIYKLMGAETVVAREKDAFLGFVRSAKY